MNRVIPKKVQFCRRERLHGIGSRYLDNELAIGRGID